MNLRRKAISGQNIGAHESINGRSGASRLLLFFIRYVIIWNRKDMQTEFMEKGEALYGLQKIQ